MTSNIEDRISTVRRLHVQHFVQDWTRWQKIRLWLGRDPAQLDLAGSQGYCVKCQVPWPCARIDTVDFLEQTGAYAPQLR